MAVEFPECGNFEGIATLFPTPVSTVSGSKGLSQFFSEYP
jgi:hypothetical protein